MLTTRCEGETFMRNLFQNEEFELDVLEAYKKSRWVKITTTTAKIIGRDDTILTENRRGRKADETFTIRGYGTNNNNSDKPRSKDETTRF